MRENTTAKVGSALAAGVAIVVALLAFSPSGRGLGPTALGRDFLAFYCAGDAVNHGADPYRAEPLGSCQRQPHGAWLASGRPGLATPAPLPGYALALFSAVARLPYDIAIVAWSLFLLVCVTVTIVGLHRLSALPLPPLIAATALTDGYASLTLGQIVPIVLAALVLAAAAVTRGQYVAAAATATIATIEPHLGLPAYLALFAWCPRSRLGLAVGAAVASAVSLVVLGPEANVEYLRAVLPAHALSEVGSVKQLSLTYLLWRLGVDQTVAVGAGTLWYGAVVGLAIVTARLLARRLEAPALLVFFPPALGLIGGAFVHIVQIAAVIPALAMLMTRTPRFRVQLTVALALLAVPWVQFESLGWVLVLFAGLAVAIVLRSLQPTPLLTTLAVSAAMLLLIGAQSMVGPVADPNAALVSHYDASRLAEDSWARYVQLVGTVNTVAYDLVRIPTVAGLLLFGATALRLTQRAPAPAAEALAGGPRAVGFH